MIKRFIADKKRGISLELFADLAGCSGRHFMAVFEEEKHPLTAELQTRVSLAYDQWLAGNVAVMVNKDQTRYIEYRKEPKPRFARTTGVEYKDGKIKVRIGIKNRADYSQSTLDEQLKRG